MDRLEGEESDTLNVEHALDQKTARHEDAEERSHARSHRNQRVPQGVDEHGPSPTQPLRERRLDVVGTHVLNEAVLHEHGGDRKRASEVRDQREDRVPREVPHLSQERQFRGTR